MKIGKIFLTGSTGMLGQNIIKNNNEFEILNPNREQLNLLDYQRKLDDEGIHPYTLCPKNLETSVSS
jgi:hypothetical protein